MALFRQSEVISDKRWQNLESINHLILNMVLRDASASKKFLPTFERKEKYFYAELELRSSQRQSFTFESKKKYIWAKEEILLSQRKNTFEPKRKYFWAKDHNVRTGEALREQAISCTSASSVDVVILGLKRKRIKCWNLSGALAEKNALSFEHRPNYPPPRTQFGTLAAFSHLQRKNDISLRYLKLS